MGRSSRYPEEFRREAVELYRSSDRPRVGVARSLGIADGSLAAWVKQARLEAESGLDVGERVELERLGRENPWVADGPGDPAEGGSMFRLGDEQVSRRFVSEYAGEYPVTRFCVLVGVPRSSFYAWRHRAPSSCDLDDEVLAEAIVDIHWASQGTYGAPRIRSPDLEEYAGRVSDSGEGRWTSIAAIDEGVPAPVLTSALYSRFASRGLDDFADRVLSAMRRGFGGHDEKES